MGQRKINPNMKTLPEIEEMIHGFRPTFGNQQDIDIFQTYSDILHLKTLIENDNAHRLEMKKSF